MQTITKLLHVRVDAADAKPAVTPIFQCSAFAADSPYFYARKDTPNVAELELALRTLEGANYAVAVTCGMSAIYLVLEFVRAGDLVVLNKDVYGCSYKLFQRLSSRRGFQLRIVDLSEESGLAAIPACTKLVFFETPTNPFLKTINIRRVAQCVKAKNADALVVVDNTWATPLYQQPLKHGADVSIHSGTKYFSGHSDVMSGVLLTDRADLYEEFRQTRFYGGMVLSPESAWLVRRSLQTLPIRLRQHEKVTLEMRDFLRKRPQVSRVYYPAVDGVQLTGYGGILFIELRADLVDRYAQFTKALKLFGTGTGMACVVSMVAQPYTGSHASLTDAEKQAMGLGRNLVRLCFGMEDPEDIKEDLRNALEAIDH